MPTVDAGVGASTANSYVTVAEADAYFDSAYCRSLWLSAEVDVKERLVISASRYLDQFIEWVGFRNDPIQSMAWPRKMADIHGYLFPHNEIPRTVKEAVFELAYHMLSSGAPISFEAQVVDRVKVGPIDVEFTNGAIDDGLPSFIEDLIGAFGSPMKKSKNTIQTVALYR